MREEDVPNGLADRDLPDFGDPSWTAPPLTAQQRVAIVSTAGLIHRGDTPFGFGSADYRIIDREDDRDLLMTHISTNFDRSGFLQDHEVVFPIKRLEELAAAGKIGSVSRYHYTFMGATNPEQMRPAALQVARSMRNEEVNVALLVPV